MSTEPTRRVGVVYRWIRNPVFRLLLRAVVIPCRFMNFAKVMEASIVSRYLAATDGDRILDIGCGFGEYSAQFAERTSAVCGVDLDARSVEVAGALSGSGVAFVVADAGQLPFRSQSFNKVASICALEHFPDDIRAIEEMNRVLVPGGVLVLSVDSFSLKPLRKGLRDKHRLEQQVVNYYKLPDIRQKLQKAGLQVRRSRYFICSSVSRFFFETQIKNYWLGAALFPCACALAIISDLLGSQDDGGYLLAVEAHKMG